MKNIQCMGIRLFGVCLMCAVGFGPKVWGEDKTHSLSLPLRVGVIASLTGDFASWGENIKNGALLALDNLAADKRQNLKLSFEDDQLKALNTVSGINKLIIDGVDFVICSTSGPCNAIAPIAEKKRLPLLAIASDPNISKGREFVFRLEISPAEEAKVLAAYIAERKLKKTVIVVAFHSGAQAAYEALKSIPTYARTEALSLALSPEETAFVTIAFKLLAPAPEAIIINLLPTGAGLLARKLKQLKYGGLLLGFNFLEGEEALTAAEGALEGIVYTGSAETSAWFQDLYAQKHGKPPGVGAAHGYDAILMLGEILPRVRSKEELIQSLTTLKDFKGALGAYSSLPGHEFSVPVVLKTVRDGRFKVLAGKD